MRIKLNHSIRQKLRIWNCTPEKLFQIYLPRAIFCSYMGSEFKFSVFSCQCFNEVVSSFSSKIFHNNQFVWVNKIIESKCRDVFHKKNFKSDAFGDINNFSSIFYFVERNYFFYCILYIKPVSLYICCGIDK